MKNAVRCENSCELQNSLIIDLFERKWRLGDALLLEPRPSERLKTSLQSRWVARPSRRSARSQLRGCVGSVSDGALSCRRRYRTRRDGSRCAGIVGRATNHRGVDVYACVFRTVRTPGPANPSVGENRPDPTCPSSVSTRIARSCIVEVTGHAARLLQGRSLPNPLAGRGVSVRHVHVHSRPQIG